MKIEGAVAKVDESSTGATAPFLCWEMEKRTPKSPSSVV